MNFLNMTHESSLCTVEHLHACTLYIFNLHFLIFYCFLFPILLSFSISVYFRGYVVIDICFVSYLAGLCKNYSPDVHKIQWKGGTWTTKKRLDLVGDPHHGCVRVRVSYQLCECLTLSSIESYP